MKNKITIALATYNGEKFLEEQLESLLMQSRHPDELVISDDCSSDCTMSIIKKFANKAPFAVRLLINEKNLGYAQNFSNALSHCTGDIVFISDQDDVWHPEKISRMLAYFDSEPSVQLLIHDLDYCKQDLSSIGQTKIERMSGVFDLQRKYVVGMATAIRAPFLKLCLPIPDKHGLAHDTWLHQCADAICGKKIIRDVLAKYRRHSSNVTVADSLNVDFIPGPDHFKNQRPNFKRLLTSKTILNLPVNSPILEWLEINGNQLVSEGYLSESRLIRIMHEEGTKIECIQKRLKILSINRLKRPWPVLKFYLDGGYCQFSSWKSAIKDIVFN